MEPKICAATEALNVLVLGKSQTLVRFMISCIAQTLADEPIAVLNSDATHLPVKLNFCLIKPDLDYARQVKVIKVASQVLERFFLLLSLVRGFNFET